MEKYYIKFYDFGIFYKLNNKEKEVFCELLKRIPLGNDSITNSVFLTPGIKKTICKDLGLSNVASLNVILYNIVKKGAMRRDGNNHFVINPNIAGKGKEDKINKVRWVYNNYDLIDKETGEIKEGGIMDE